MYSHGMLKTANYLSLEFYEQLYQETLAFYFNEDFALSLRHEFMRYRLDSEQFFPGPLAACQCLLCQEDLAKSSFT
jgi:hypothetical protein